MKIDRLLWPAVVLIAGLAMGCTYTCPCPHSGMPANPPVMAAARPYQRRPEARARSPERPDAMVRLEFEVSTRESGKPDNTTKYVLNLAEHHSGELNVGSNIVLSSPDRQGGARAKALPPPEPVRRMDVGLKIRCSFDNAGDGLLLRTSTEFSGHEEGAVRKLSSTGETKVGMGKPTLVTSIEDPANHKLFEVRVTAVKAM